MVAPTPPLAQPPPPIPSDPTISNALSNYLTQFSLWCRRGFAAQLKNNVGLPGILLQANDAPSGTIPVVYQLGVDTAGELTLAPVPFSGTPGTPVPLQFSETLSIQSVDNLYAYVGFYDSSQTLHGVVGWVSGDGGLEMFNPTSGGALVLNDNGLTYFYGATQFNSGGFFSGIDGYIANPAINTTSYRFDASAEGNDAYISFLSPNVYGVNFGLNANGNFYMGGWSAGENYIQFWTSRDFANPACDYRIKEDVKPLASTWDDVKALRPVSYRQKERKAKSGGRPLIEADPRERWGFIAHELQEDLIETAATGQKDIEDRLQAPDTLAIIAALTRTVQELQARVEALEER
jgi:hypothetical protein